MDASKRFDLVITGATIIDGSGAPGYVADLGVRDARIAAIGDLANATSGSRVDAAGRVLSPGFIDAHCHDDRALLSMPLLEPKLSQGVTTVVNGNCGISLAPVDAACAELPPPLDLLSRDRSDFFLRFADYLARLDAEPPAVNSLCLTGHTSLRVGAMARLDRAASTDEIARMRATLEECLAAGSIGLSTGIYYPPARHASTEEIVGVAQALAGYGGIYVTHMRDEADRVTESLQETFRIGREARVPVVVSHHKCVGPHNHGRSRETLALIERAGHEQPVGLDAYPYVAGSTVLNIERASQASRVIVTWSERFPEVAGRDLDDIAREMGCTPAQAVPRLLPAGGTFFVLDEDDVQRILAYPHTMIGSDGICEDAHPHPRAWGTFPRVLGHYARDLGLFPLEEAVRKMTSLPAARFGIAGRGTIRVGACADLVLFDPRTIIDTADFDEPKRPAAGVDRVFVNGRLAWCDGAPTGERAGTAIRRASS